MVKQWLPWLATLHFPGRIILLDDDRPFLNQAPKRLNNRFHIETWEYPKKLLAFLKNWTQPISLQEHVNLPMSITPGGQHIYRIDINNLDKLFCHPRRSQQITVIIADYAMPSMNGLDFFKALKLPHVKRILMTGQADYSLAVAAFNEGLIDHFILKQSPDFFESLDTAIQRHHDQYFHDLTAHLIQDLSQSPFYCLNHSGMRALLAKYFTHLKPQAWHWLDATGSQRWYLANGQQYNFVMKTAYEMTTLTHIARDNDAPDSLLTALANNHILAFHSDRDYNLPISHWLTKLLPARTIKDITNQFDNYALFWTDYQPMPQLSKPYLKLIKQ